ncbi:hypothetical protein HS088_TW01G00855 [Tripterygium wilfordii]|uniref:Uncharacterized protein n=1 Tax=Tripterygium wilfordii TaxID=458696 RepID=A0A7J7E2X4_TRIWF|nr:hypothetical protein HS088_TW01G00855 [Tripterygium wilfordii]
MNGAWLSFLHAECMYFPLIFWDCVLLNVGYISSKLSMLYQPDKSMLRKILGMLAARMPSASEQATKRSGRGNLCVISMADKIVYSELETWNLFRFLGRANKNNSMRIRYILL